jgi:hypothetical protein
MGATVWKTFLVAAARGGWKAHESLSSLACLTSLSIAFKIKIWKSCASTTARKTGLDGPKNGLLENSIFVSLLSQPVLERLRELDLDRLMPLEALNLLAELKKEI